MPTAGVHLRLFREATQLKTVGAAGRVAGIEVRHVEIQVHPIASVHKRRIAEPVTADVAQPAIGSLAEARGVPRGSAPPKSELRKQNISPGSKSPIGFVESSLVPFIPRGTATENRGRGCRSNSGLDTVRENLDAGR